MGLGSWGSWKQDRPCPMGEQWKGLLLLARPSPAPGRQQHGDEATGTSDGPRVTARPKHPSRSRPAG